MTLIDVQAVLLVAFGPLVVVAATLLIFTALRIDTWTPFLAMVAVLAICLTPQYLRG